MARAHWLLAEVSYGLSVVGRVSLLPLRWFVWFMSLMRGTAATPCSIRKDLLRCLSKLFDLA